MLTNFGIHKPSKKMKKIVFVKISRTRQIAKWLVKEFQNMEKQFQARSVKNSSEFSNAFLLIWDIEEGKILVYFGIKALFRVSRLKKRSLH